MTEATLPEATPLRLVDIGARALVWLAATSLTLFAGYLIGEQLVPMPRPQPVANVDLYRAAAVDSLSALSPCDDGSSPIILGVNFIGTELTPGSTNLLDVRYRCGTGNPASYIWTATFGAAGH